MVPTPLEAAVCKLTQFTPILPEIGTLGQMDSVQMVV